MFGYVRPALNALPPQEQEAYRGAYCGLCHAMGRQHGFWSRFTLNYDFTFLGILFAAGDGGEICLRRCPAHPLRKRRECFQGAGLDAAADASVILTWYKLRDDVADKGFWAGLPARFLSRVFGRSARRAAERNPAFAARTEEGLCQLRRLEEARAPELDRAADAFARILQAAAPDGGDETFRRAAEQLLYHVGRWIYLVDAWDDLKEDRQAGRYNPLDARFEGSAEQERDYVATTMTHSLRMAASAANLMELGRWEPVILNTIYRGLPAVQEAVLSGQWKEIKKKHREISR